MSDLVFTMDGHDQSLRETLSQTTLRVSKHDTKYYNITFWNGIQWYLWPNDYYRTNVQLWFDNDDTIRRFYKSPLSIPVYKIMKSQRHVSGFTKVSVVLPRVDDLGNMFLYIPKMKLGHDYFIFNDSIDEIDFTLLDDVKLWHN